MYSLKKWMASVLLSLGIVILFQPAAMPVHAASGDTETVKEAYEEPGDQKNANNESENSQQNEAPGKDAVGLTFLDFLRMGAALLFVIALLFILLRFINKKNRAFQRANFLENMGGTSLGGNRSIQLVKVGGKILVVGVGENIQVLSEITDEKEIKEITDSRNTAFNQQTGAMDFLAKLTDLKAGLKPQKKEDFQSVFKNKIKELKEDRKDRLKDLERKGRDRDE
ncbi:flagellar biosynthetic protein FliO [Bacillus massiliglaciei]|uniref:flagellar biosynthetic protein FliO n=1 Tax=Bacillus massiliglaciei TaxID=1816693 RepID=UPI000DA62201|nr:flagellar biosynthetic protein FliO [Bacillus massiliglaciei]